MLLLQIASLDETISTPLQESRDCAKMGVKPTMRHSWQKATFGAISVVFAWIVRSLRDLSQKGGH